MGWLKKQNGDTGKGVSPAEALKNSPKGLEALMEFLMAAQYDDGSPRTTGTLNIFFEGSQCKVSLSDRDQEAMAFMTCTDLLSAFMTADKKLREGSLDWRKFKSAKKK